MIASSIEEHAQFTTTVVTSAVRPRAAELVVVSLRGASPDYVGVSQAGRRIATGQMRLLISNLVRVKRILPGEFQQQLPRKFAKRFLPPTIGEYRPTPRLWQEILAILAAQAPGTQERIRNLARIVADTQRPKRRIRGGLEIFERDAIASALQTWRGIPFRKRILRSAIPSEQASLAPFQSPREVLEDDMRRPSAVTSRN
jgi:hypothetical protein